MTSYYRNDPDPFWEKNRDRDPTFFDTCREYALTEYNSSLTAFLEEYSTDDDDFFMMQDSADFNPKDVLDAIFEDSLSSRSQRYMGYYLKKFPH